MSRIAKDALLLLVCLVLIVPAALLASGKLPYQVYIVHTGSMTPTIPSRSAVLVKKGAYHLGQVISFRTQNGVVTHRLIKRGADGTLVTKGDANRTADPGSLRATQVIGGVLAAPRMLGYWLQYLKNPAGVGSLALTIVCFWLTYSIAVSVAERRQLVQAPAAKWRTVNASAAKRRVGWRIGRPFAGAPRAERRSAALLMPAGVTAPLLAGADHQRRVTTVAPLPMPGGVPASLFAEPGHQGHVNAGVPRAPGIDPAVAQAVGYDRLAAVWKPVLSGPPIVFTCGRCGAAFATTGELRGHVSGHRSHAATARPRVATAVHS